MYSWIWKSRKWIIYSPLVLTLIGSVNPAFGLEAGDSIVDVQNFSMKEADNYDYWLVSLDDGTILLFEYKTNTDFKFAIMPYEIFLVFAQRTSERLAQSASFENEVRMLSWKYYEVANEGSQNTSLTIPTSGKYVFLILRPSNPISKLKVSVTEAPKQPLESRIADLEKTIANYRVQITNLQGNFTQITQNQSTQLNTFNKIDYFSLNITLGGISVGFVSATALALAIKKYSGKKKPKDSDPPSR